MLNLLVLVTCIPMWTACGRMQWYAGLWPVPRWAPARAPKLHWADGCWGTAGGAAWPSPFQRRESAEPDSTPPAPAVCTRSSCGTGSPCSLQEPAEDSCVRISGWTALKHPRMKNMWPCRIVLYKSNRMIKSSHATSTKTHSHKIAPNYYNRNALCMRKHAIIYK